MVAAARRCHDGRSLADWSRVRDTVIALLASLGIVAQIAIAVLVLGILAWLVVPATRGALAGPRQAVQEGGVWLAWGVALVATLGSLWFSEFADFVPCRLCWFQRIFMYPLAIVLLVGALFRDRRVVWYALPLTVIGALFSAYHVYVEINPEVESAACRAGGVPCSLKWIDEFGYITIPVLAGTAFVLIGLLLAVVALRGRGAGGGPRPG
jgi:disulfide bond formation protein DsbB